MSVIAAVIRCARHDDPLRRQLTPLSLLGITVVTAFCADYRTSLSPWSVLQC
jgi:hypothetical protein